MSLRARVDRLEDRCRKLSEELENYRSLHGALPCDLCGSSSSLRMRIETSGRASSARVECEGCGVSGPHGSAKYKTAFGLHRFADRELAVNEWNNIVFEGQPRS